MCIVKPNEYSCVLQIVFLCIKFAAVKREITIYPFHAEKSLISFKQVIFQTLPRRLKSESFTLKAAYLIFFNPSPCIFFTVYNNENMAHLWSYLMLQHMIFILPTHFENWDQDLLRRVKSRMFDAPTLRYTSSVVSIKRNSQLSRWWPPAWRVREPVHAPIGVIIVQSRIIDSLELCVLLS